jgi:light-regulated signal transduction histidine kinase (bacteriophytochrome)
MGEAATAVAYDLADPLTIIVSLAHSLLKEDGLNDEMKAQLRQIIEAAFCCQRLVQSVLSFVEAKASINAMAHHINLSNILLDGRSEETRRQTTADLP